jgi:hypothetical protein
MSYWAKDSWTAPLAQKLLISSANFIVLWHVLLLTYHFFGLPFGQILAQAGGLYLRNGLGLNQSPAQSGLNSCVTRTPATVAASREQAHTLRFQLRSQAVTEAVGSGLIAFGREAQRRGFSTGEQASSVQSKPAMPVASTRTATTTCNTARHNVARTTDANSKGEMEDPT